MLFKDKFTQKMVAKRPEGIFCCYSNCISKVVVKSSLSLAYQIFTIIIMFLISLSPPFSLPYLPLEMTTEITAWYWITLKPEIALIWEHYARGIFSQTFIKRFNILQKQARNIIRIRRKKCFQNIRLRRFISLFNIITDGHYFQHVYVTGE